MADTTLIKAHQQSAAPLLRRPRPPKALTTLQQPISRRHEAKERRKSPQKSPRSKQTTPFNPTPSPFHYQDQDTLINSKTDFPIHSLHPKGPSFFPPGKKLVAHYDIDSIHMPGLWDRKVDFIREMPESGDFEQSSDYLESEGDFALADFQTSAEVSPQQRLLCEEGSKVISRQNYLKLTGWFAVHVPTQESLNTVELDVGVQCPGDRKPRHQALLELRSMVEEALMATASAASIDSEREPLPLLDPPDLVINSSLSRYFCGQGRSNSPFKSSDQPEISPAEVAILDCMMSGGGRLDLKAQFITHLPDLTPLSRTLTYLNISFNCLNVFPVEILQLPRLAYLQMRNNPIKEIPNDIKVLTRLRVLCVSFNLLSDLPQGLFELRYLHELDVSYNTLHSISRNISNLVSLHKLNVEGNQLVGLPSTSMSLPLSHLLVGDNLMHPILWRENTRNQPQELVDLCCMVVSRCVSATDDPRLSEGVIDILQRPSGHACDQCQRTLYGCGLRVIRAVSDNVFGLKNLPFVFLVCSPPCRAAIKCRENSDWTQPFHAH